MQNLNGSLTQQLSSRKCGASGPDAGAYRRFPNLLYRRFPNRQTVRVPGAPVMRTACGLGNPRYSRLGSLRYKKTAPPLRLHLKPIDAYKVQDVSPHPMGLPPNPCHPPSVVRKFQL